MTNAEKFQKVFGFYATEMWAKPEKEFLEWVNSEALEYEPGEDLISRADRAMTREEIIKWLESLKAEIGKSEDTEKDDRR